ncbi:MAG: dephospho-CoA kinase [Fimbriimonadaceae bacterium]|nr:dephospho-CoA kinase [Fimbriimonadaceae bacterium]
MEHRSRRRLIITGGIAQGKSTVLGYLRDAGYATLSADDVARRVYEEAATQDRLAEIVGRRVGRAELRALLARDARVRREVNALMHGEVFRRLAASDAQVLEIPLYAEACLLGFGEEVWAVTCDETARRRRLVERLGDEVEADRLIATQLPSRAKNVLADRVVNTDDPPVLVRQTVLAWASEFFGRG